MHICIQLLEIGTVEHQMELMHEATDLGQDYCFLRFASNSYSDPEVSRFLDKNVSSSHLITTLQDLLLHFSSNNSLGIFIQSPYPEHQPDWFEDPSLDGKFIYAGYGLSLSDWSAGHFDLDIFSRCKFIFSESKFNYKELKKRYGKVVLLTGNPLLWGIKNSYRRSSRSADANNSVLWAPHWSPSWFSKSRGFSRIQEVAPQLLEWAIANPDIKIVFRPHPILRSAINWKLNTDSSASPEVYKVIDESLTAECLNSILELMKLENFAISNNSMKHDILNTSRLLTEGVSIIGYWSVTGKPILVWRDNDSPLFNSVGERLMQRISTVDSQASLNSWLDNKDQKVDKRLARLSSRTFPTFTNSPIQILNSEIQKIKN